MSGSAPGSALSRLSHAVICLLAVIGLIFNYVATISGHPGELVVRSVRYLSFFTIDSNLLVAIVSGAIALGGGWAARSGIRTAVSLYVIVVAVIFHLLLAGLVSLSPLGWWGNMLAHQLVPLLWVCAWLAFQPHGGITPRATLVWLIFPVLYGLWSVVHGAMSGFYPYPFLDVAKFGGAAIARNMLAMAVFFAALGYLLRWIDARLARQPA